MSEVVPEMWPIEGSNIEYSAITHEKAQRLVDLLRSSGDELYASLKEIRKRDDGAETVVFTVNVQRPQKLVHDVRRIELVQAVFTKDEERAPEVWLLRKSFPLVPHTNLTLKGMPRQACLYEQGWDEVRLNWNAAQFLMRIRHWLAHTATGTLHAEDQPLEPLIMPSQSRLILPSDFSLTKANAQNGLLGIGRLPTNGPGVVLAAQWKGQGKELLTHSAAAIFECQPQQHGVIRHQPQNLFELNELCLEAGLNLVQELTTKVQQWHLEKPDPKILQAQLIIILLLPKSRSGAVIESVDVCAFLTGRTVQDVGQALGAIGKVVGQVGYIIGKVEASEEDVKRVPLALIQIHHSLDAAAAARLNGMEPNRQQVVAIGMGALGSQIFNNMIRAGYGTWCLIDGDILLPHNCARHFLGSWAVGQSKAEAMAEVANAIFDGPDIAKAIDVDLLKPGEKKAEVEKAMAAADTLMDFSASVAVTRHLGNSAGQARVLSAFLTPGGGSLVTAIEDKERNIRIDWLEMLHYRSVLKRVQLRTTLAVESGNVRYGNSCRDLSSKISQDDVSLWAAEAGRTIKKLLEQDEAALEIAVKTEAGGIEIIKEDVTPVLSVIVGKWTLRFDRKLMQNLAEYRSSKLPNETGGVLVGHFDTHNHMCSVVDMIPSPPDSVEWPVSYIRGCEGLHAKIEEIGNLTLGQLQYVGEWHSHPDDCPTSPSSDDLQAYSWLVAHMNKEDLPALMMIVGQDQGFHFVAMSR